MMQVESPNLLDTFKRSQTLTSQESVQLWIDSLADDEYHSNSDDDRPRSRHDDSKLVWQSSLSVPESDDGLALGAEAKSFVGVSDIIPLSPRLSPLLGHSEATTDSHFNVDASLSPRTNSDPFDVSPRNDNSRRPSLPFHPSFDSSDTLPSGVASVSSLLAYLEPDPIDMLTNLGFGDVNSHVFARVPTRFFQNNSSVKGVNTKEFVDTHLENEKSSSFVTAEDESVSMILGRFRENSIDMDFDHSSCRSVYSSRSSTNPPIPDIRIEEVDSSQEGLAFHKKLDTLLEENEALASPHGSFCLPDFRPPLLRQKIVFTGRKSPICGDDNDDVFVAENYDSQYNDAENELDSSNENYFDDEKRVTVKRDSTLVDTSNISTESIDRIGAARKLSNASANPPTSREASLEVLDSPAKSFTDKKFISQNSDASTVVPPTLKLCQENITDNIVNSVIDGFESFDDKASDLSGSVDMPNKNDFVKPFVNDSARTFAPSPNSAFDECSSKSNSRLPSMNEMERLPSSLTELKDTMSSPSAELRRNVNILIPVSDPFGLETSHIPHSTVSPLNGFPSSYLEHSERSQPFSQLLSQKQKAFSVKNFSIESSGFEDENDPIRLSPVKGTRTAFSSPSGIYDSCPLCGSPQLHGKYISSPTTSTRNHSISSSANNRTDDVRIRTNTSRRHHSEIIDDRSAIQYMSEQLKHLKSDINRKESQNRIYLDERLEQTRSDLLSEISQFVLMQFDTISDSLKAKDAEILRLRRQLYEDSGTGL